MRANITTAGLLILSGLVGQGSAVCVWDFEQDWDRRPISTQAPPGWAYMVFEQDTQTYVDLTYRNTSYFDYPVMPPTGYTHSFPYVSRWHTAYPGTHGTSIKAAVVRFIAPYGADFSVDAWFTRFEDNTNGNGVDVAIFAGGIRGLTFPAGGIPDFSSSNAVWHSYLADTSYGQVRSYGPCTFSLCPCDLIDFAVFNHGDDQGDGMRLNAHIEFVPEAHTSIVAFAGALMMRHRQRSKDRLGEPLR